MQRKETPAWWREKVKQLADQAEPFATIRPEQVYKKKGCWPLIKLVAMKYALGFYAPITAKRRERGAVDSIHFIDFCAGSGLTQIKPPTANQSVTVTGTALIGALEKTFNHFHFVEPRKVAARALQERLESLLAPDEFTVYAEDRAPAVLKIRRALDTAKRSHYMAFVDPEGFKEVTLPQLEPLLRGKGGDLLFNYQYMGVKRAPDAASEFFGYQDWPRYGTMEEMRHILPNRLADYGRPAVKSVNIVSGSGPYAYDLVYAARETVAGNPWLANYEAEMSKRTDGIDGRTICRWILEGQQSLF